MNSSSEIPSPADVAFYREHGWWVSPRIVPEPLLDDAAAALGRFYAGDRDHELDPLAVSRDWTPDRGDVLRLNSYVSMQMDAIAVLVRFPELGRMASHLSGSPRMRLFRDSVFFKPPLLAASNTMVGWHVDRAYWLSCTSESMLTAWIPLQDSDASNGTLSVIDGSHQWSEHTDLRTFEDQDLAALERRFRPGRAPVREVALRVPRGAVSFHHCRTIHGSRANTSDQARVAVTVHMQDDGNRYRVAWDHENKRVHHLNDFLCQRTPEGDPDYSDPAVFPLLWDELAHDRGSSSAVRSSM